MLDVLIYLLIDLLTTYNYLLLYNVKKLKLKIVYIKSNVGKLDKFNINK